MNPFARLQQELLLDEFKQDSPSLTKRAASAYRGLSLRRKLAGFAMAATLGMGCQVVMHETAVAADRDAIPGVQMTVPDSNECRSLPDPRAYRESLQREAGAQNTLPRKMR